MRLAAILLIVIVSLVRPALGHRLDEYLQAATLSVEPDHVRIQLRLTPGIQVLNQVLPEIDTDGDGTLTEAEQTAYARRVGHELSLSINGQPRPLRPISVSFPPMAEMKTGLGDILLTYESDVSLGGGEQQLVFENHHLSRCSAYMANCLVPRNADLRITSQDRSYDQSVYRLSCTIDKTAEPVSGASSMFRAFVYQGIHHILTGYDHLLFVSALVLAATTLWDLIKVVSTFTLAHTLTLTLAAVNLVHLPERVVEPLIAASIVFVALQNVFWPGRARGWSRLGAAFFFGLFHGLGFAGGFLEAMQQMQPSMMLLAIAAFSIGVEVGHQMVVLPLFSILRLARHTRGDAVSRARLSMIVQRLGSAGIAVAGIYYLQLAIRAPL